jgi:hypothetical protein
MTSRLQRLLAYTNTKINNASNSDLKHYIGKLKQEYLITTNEYKTTIDLPTKQQKTYLIGKIQELKRYNDADLENIRRPIRDKEGLDEEQNKLLEKLDARTRAIEKLKDDLFANAVVRQKKLENGLYVEDTEASYIKPTEPERTNDGIGAGMMGIQRRLATHEYTPGELKRAMFPVRVYV